MTAREAIEKLDHAFAIDEEYEAIDKELRDLDKKTEILRILKKHLLSNCKFSDDEKVLFIGCNIVLFDEKYETIKEWLEEKE